MSTVSLQPNATHHLRGKYTHTHGTSWIGTTTITIIKTIINSIFMEFTCYDKLLMEELPELQTRNLLWMWMGMELDMLILSRTPPYQSHNLSRDSCILQQLQKQPIQAHAPTTSTILSLDPKTYVGIISGAGCKELEIAFKHCNNNISVSPININHTMDTTNNKNITKINAKSNEFKPFYSLPNIKSNNGMQMQMQQEEEQLQNPIKNALVILIGNTQQKEMEQTFEQKYNFTVIKANNYNLTFDCTDLKRLNENNDENTYECTDFILQMYKCKTLF